MHAPQATMDALRRHVAPVLADDPGRYAVAQRAYDDTTDALARLQGAHVALLSDADGEARWEAALVDARASVHALAVLLYAADVDVPGPVLTTLRDLSALTGRCVEA